MENTAPKWFLWAAILLVLWNAYGVYMFASEAFWPAASAAQKSAEQKLLWSQLPMWGWAGFAVGTIGGLLAALGLVLKKKWAASLALLSVLGVIVNFIPTFVLSEGVNVWQPQFYIVPIFIFVVALLQLWLARKANSKGWMN